MEGPNQKRPSLSAFISQTARLLRGAASSVKKKRKYSKEDGLSASNKINQIASLLRSQAQKIKPRKKKDH